MTFSTRWNNAYEKNTHLSVWPWPDLIRNVMKYAGPFNNKFRVLELGFGAGANIPFFISLNVEYFGIEGSEVMVESLKRKFPQLKNNLIAGDFTQNIPFSGNFNLVVDRSSLTHNTTHGIENCLNQIYEKLIVGGKFIGIDWFSTLHSDYQKGDEGADTFTRTDYQSGQFANIGNVHFSDKAHLLNLFKKFKIHILEHKKIQTEIPTNNHVFASWNFVAEKTA